ncbi:MAG: PAS domain S-box protein [Erysipelotrichaceae bacterium]|nr:PAS domain S-box protein [Erysipelotrichaceae bacterium]
MKYIRILILLIIVFIFTISSANAYDDITTIDFFEMFNEHGSIMLIIDVETGEIVFSNIAAQKFYGYTKNELESMAIQEINTMTDEEVSQERINAVSEKRNHFIFKHQISSGEIKTVEVFSYPYYSSNQNLLFSIINDITAARALEETKKWFEIATIILLSILLIVVTLFSRKVFQLLNKYRKEHSLLNESNTRNKHLVNSIQGMVYRGKDDEFWTMDYVSEGCLALTGYTPSELTNNTVIDFNSLIEVEDRKILRVKETLHNELDSIFEYEYRIITKDGARKWVLERGQCVNSNDDGCKYFEGIITDITNIKNTEEKSREYQEKLYATLISVGDGVITTDQEGNIELINPVTQKITGWSQKDAFGEKFETVFNIVDEYSREKRESPVKKAFETKSVVELANHTVLISKHGLETSIEDTAAPIFDKNGNILGSVLIFRDNSEKHEKRRAIEYISFHDHMTGVYNRRFFEEELKRLDCSRNYPLSLIILDVNGLKLINDSFGHDSGDLLIKKLAKVLQAECRQDDIISRYGGDEFVILLPKTDQLAVEELARRVKQSASQESINNLEISVSIGWSTKYDDSTDTNKLINDAENFMYQKKIVENSSKRNQVIRSIMNTLLVKNPREEGHSKRVSQLCEKIGHALCLPKEEIQLLVVASELHDIGKITIDTSILDKAGKLDEEEWKQIKQHPNTGFRILSTSGEYSVIADVICSHHERWDGHGYPFGLKGADIPYHARIIAIADTYDAITSERPYHSALGKAAAYDEIKRSSGSQLDPDIVNVFLNKVINNL